MNVYSELLDLLTPEKSVQSPVCFGTLREISPLTIAVEGTEVTKNLYYPREMVFHVEQIGSELALLPCENGFLILFQVEGGVV